MSCCGKQRQSFQTAPTDATRQDSRNNTPQLPSRTWRSTLDFEYTGQTAMTVIGPVSGQRYEFVKPGAVIAVDVRDRRFFAAIPNLKQR